MDTTADERDLAIYIFSNLGAFFFSLSPPPLFYESADDMEWQGRKKFRVYHTHRAYVHTYVRARAHTFIRWHTIDTADTHISHILDVYVSCPIVWIAGIFYGVKKRALRAGGSRGRTTGRRIGIGEPSTRKSPRGTARGRPSALLPPPPPPRRMDRSLSRAMDRWSALMSLRARSRGRSVPGIFGDDVRVANGRTPPPRRKTAADTRREERPHDDVSPRDMWKIDNYAGRGKEKDGDGGGRREREIERERKVAIYL